MAKDSLADAIFELKDRDRKAKKARRKKQHVALKKVGTERPKAFDSFHFFSLMLLAFGIALQFVALALYA